MRFEFRQVDHDHPVVIFVRLRSHFHICFQIILNSIGPGGNRITSGSTQVSRHIQVVREQGCSSSYFSTHITNSSFPGCRDRRSTVTEIFYDGICPSFYGQDTGQLQDHILRRSPAAQASGQFDTDQFRHLQFPFHSGHYVDSIGTSNSDSHHSEATGIRRVRVGTDHHSTGESIVFQYHLVDNSGSRFPKTDTELIGYGFEEIIYFAVSFGSRFNIRFRSDIRLDQVIAVDGCRNSRFIFPCIHKLQ